MRESGSLAVLALVFFFFMPSIRAQKESLRGPPSGWGGFKFMPCFFAEARPLAFRPPFGFFPSFLCHAGDLAISYLQFGFADCIKQRNHNLFAEVVFKCFGSNVRQTNVDVSMDFETMLTGAVTE